MPFDSQIWRQMFGTGIFQIWTREFSLFHKAKGQAVKAHRLTIWRALLGHLLHRIFCRSAFIVIIFCWPVLTPILKGLPSVPNDSKTRPATHLSQNLPFLLRISEAIVHFWDKALPMHRPKSIQTNSIAPHQLPSSVLLVAAPSI